MKYLGDVLIFLCAIIIACGIMYVCGTFGHEVIGLFLSLFFLAWYGEIWSKDLGKKS